MSLTILNIGIDRDLLDNRAHNEARLRQHIYCRELPAHIVHVVKAPRGTTVDAIEDQALSILPCPVAHWALFPFAAFRRGASVLRRRQVDIIQVQEPFLTGIAGALLAWRFQKPLVVGIYSDEIDNPSWLSARPLHRLANLIGKAVLRRAAAVRCDSADAARRITALNVHNVRFVPFLITQALDLATPQPAAAALRAELLQGRKGPLLLALARLEPEKNIALLLRAFSRIVQKHAGAMLAIAGDGRMRAELESLAEKVAPGRVRWLGRIGAQSVAAHYQASDLTLLSSDRESAARVLSESLLAGTPVLTTDTAGAREIVEDGVSGLVVAVGDEDGFSNALEALCADSDRLKVMSAHAKGAAASGAGVAAVIAALRELYDIARGR